MILSIVLYGSRARGDYRLDSDIDMLALVEKGKVRQELGTNGVSLYHYPVDLLKFNAKNGDLFTLHLKTEGKILHDTSEIFQSIVDSFEYKESYAHIIMQSAYIILFLSSRPALLASGSARKRLIWAMRTIIIAKAAERKIAIFSSSDLADFCDMPSLQSIIDTRGSSDTAQFVNSALYLLNHFNLSKYINIWPDDKAEQRRRLRLAGGLAADTIKYSLRKNTLPKIKIKKNIHREHRIVY